MLLSSKIVELHCCSTEKQHNKNKLYSYHKKQSSESARCNQTTADMQKAVNLHRGRDKQPLVQYLPLSPKSICHAAGKSYGGLQIISATLSWIQWQIFMNKKQVGTPISYWWLSLNISWWTLKGNSIQMQHKGLHVFLIIRAGGCKYELSQFNCRLEGVFVLDEISACCYSFLDSCKLPQMMLDKAAVNFIWVQRHVCSL